MGDQPTLIASVQRALRLLEAIGGYPNGAPAKRLARDTGLALPTTYHLLRTLVHEGFAERRADGSYLVGSRVSVVNDRARAQRRLGSVRTTLERLRDELSAPVYLSTYDDGEIRLRDVADGPRSRRIQMWVPFESARHATALGKCVLRCLDPERRADYLARHRLADLTPRTITGRRQLLAWLEHTDDSITTDVEEYAVGTACLAAPVRAPGLVGAVAVSVPAHRLATAGPVGPALVAAAGRISRALALTG